MHAGRDLGTEALPGGTLRRGWVTWDRHIEICLFLVAIEPRGVFR